MKLFLIIVRILHRMRLLFFDTETNGLPWNRHGTYKNTENWPRILQIAWQVWNVQSGTKPVCIQKVNAYSKPEPDLKWDAESAKIHGLTLQLLETKGKPVKEILHRFANDCKEVDIIIAHNLKFDKMALWAAYVRMDMEPTHFWPSHELCTMNATIQICKIPGKNPTPEDPYKWPRLSEVYQFLFPGKPLPQNLHDANEDVNLLIVCTRELVQRRLVPLPACERLVDRLVLALRALSNSTASSAL